MSDENPFAGLEPPEPPAGLREAALGAGRAAFAAAPRSDPWTRLYRSPAARLAWAASVTLLVAAHLLLPAHRPSVPTTASAPAGHEDPEVKAIARLPRIDDRALAAREGARS